VVTGMGEIAVSYKPTLGDVLHAARVAEGESWRTSSRVVSVLLGLCGVAFVYLGFGWWAVLWLALGAAEWFNLLPSWVLVAYVEFKRNPKYRQEYHLSLSREQLSFRTATIDSKLKWEHYTRFWETHRAFVLSSGTGLPTFIPKAAFAGDAERDAARELLTSVITRRALEKSGAA
jgi:hypothetical protein